MLLALLAAAHVGAFCLWACAAAAEAVLAEAGEAQRALPLARRWAPAAMGLCLAAGTAALALSYPFYRGQAWLWLKLAAALAAAVVTVLRALGGLRPRPALWALALTAGLALVLSFTRAF